MSEYVSNLTVDMTDIMYIPAMCTLYRNDCYMMLSSVY